MKAERCRQFLTPLLYFPQQTWLVTPILFSAVALFLLFMPIFASPTEALAALGFVTLGVPAYYLTQGVGRLPSLLQKWRGGSRAERDDGLRSGMEDEEGEEEVEMLMRKSEDAAGRESEEDDRGRGNNGKNKIDQEEYDEDQEFKIGEEDDDEDESSKGKI